MSFTREEVLQEFEEAARMGRRNHTEQVRTYHEVRWWLEIGFETARPVPKPIEPAGIQRSVCPRCGAQVERREGSRRLIHITTAGACGGKRKGER